MIEYGMWKQRGTQDGESIDLLHRCLTRVRFQRGPGFSLKKFETFRWLNLMLYSFWNGAAKWLFHFSFNFGFGWNIFLLWKTIFATFGGDWGHLEFYACYTFDCSYTASNDYCASHWVTETFFCPLCTSHVLFICSSLFFLNVSTNCWANLDWISQLISYKQNHKLSSFFLLHTSAVCSCLTREKKCSACWGHF